MEVKKELLLNLHEASTDTTEAWEGVHPDQLLLQLASAWEIDLQQHDKQLRENKSCSAIEFELNGIVHFESNGVWPPQNNYIATD